MIELLDIWLPGVIPSKNARTRVNTQTGRLYTEPSVRAWMEEVAFSVRRKRTAFWQKGMDMEMFVVVHCSDKGVWKFDLDGALPCLVDAVCEGLMPDDRKRPPDEYITHLEAWKLRDDKDGVLVRVEGTLR
jgi:Holliday junction resolvase RusA-like endonuclease